MWRLKIEFRNNNVKGRDQSERVEIRQISEQHFTRRRRRESLDGRKHLRVKIMPRGKDRQGRIDFPFLKEFRDFFLFCFVLVVVCLYETSISFSSPVVL